MSMQVYGELRIAILEKPRSDSSLLMYPGVKGKTGRWDRTSQKSNQDKIKD